MLSVAIRQKQGHEVALNPLPYSPVAATQYLLGLCCRNRLLVLPHGQESHSPAGSGGAEEIPLLSRDSWPSIDTCWDLCLK